MSIISYMSVYKIAFFLTLLIAETRFMKNVKKRSFFPLRLAIGLAGFFVLAWIQPNVLETVHLSLMFGSFAGYLILMNRFIWELDWKSCIFFAVAGYSMQHTASIIYGMITAFMQQNFVTLSVNPYSTAAAKFDLSTILVFVEVYVVVYWILLAAFGKRIRQSTDFGIKSPKLLGVASMMLLVEIVMNSCIIAEQNSGHLPYAYYNYGALANLLCTLSTMIILFNLLIHKTLEDELELAQRIWHQDQKQYDIARETIDMINVKCHDMKHQLHELRHAVAIDPKALRELEQNIEIYGAIAKTGNEALDVILTEKSLYCQKNGIQISSIIDGEKLSFMQDMDIYSLFGNLLDNAINSVMNLDAEKRCIGLNVKAHGALLSINSHNYYTGDIQIRDGRPVTTNSDVRYHGFGTRSMMLIVNKYGGTIDFIAEEGIFNVNILFPLKGDS